MIRLALLGLLATAAIAGDSPLLTLPEAERIAAVRALLAPGQVVLPGGTTSLAAAIDALAAGGNRVVLAEGLDDRREVLVPACSGSWWEGVRTVCNAFSLRFDEGIVSGDRLDGEGIPLPVGHGVLVLSSDPSGPPAFAISGAIAVVAETENLAAGDGRSLIIRAWARAEPHIPRGRLAWARAVDARLGTTGAGGITLRPAGNDGGDTRPPALLWQADIAQAEPATLTASFTLRIGALERWTARSDLRLGGQARLVVAGQTIDAALFGDGSPALWMETVLPERRPLLAILGPEGLVEGCQVRLRSGGQDLASGGGGSSSGNGRCSMFRFPRNLPEGQLEVVIEGSASVAPTDNAIAIAIGKRRQVTLPDPDAPARLQLAAGSQPLSRWIAQLAAGGNTILPEVGIDTNAIIALPGVDGTFWDGVIALCTAADLAPAPTVGSEIASGPLRLVSRQGRPLIAAACGPLLILADNPRVTSDGPEREVQVRLTLLAEPQVAADRFLSPAIAWATFAEDAAGGLAQVLTPLTDLESRNDQQQMARQRFIRIRRDSEATDILATLVTTIRVPRPETRSLTLSGLVMLQRARSLRTTAELAINGSVEAVLGGRPVEFSTTSSSTVSEVRQGSGLILRGVSGLEGLSISATNEDGVAIELTDGSGRMIPLGREPGLRLARCKLPPAGNLIVELTAREQRPPLALPLRLIVPLP